MTITEFYGGESLDDNQRDQAHIKQHRLNYVVRNVFAQGLLLSLRAVDDPGTRVVISTLVFNTPPNGDQGSTDSNDEGSRNAEMLQRGEVELGQRNSPMYVQGVVGS